MAYGYWHSKMNYKREKRPDGSVTVTRTPEFDGDGISMAATLLVLLPITVFLLGVVAICFCGLTFVWGAIPILWGMTIKASVGAFILAAFAFFPICFVK